MCGLFGPYCQFCGGIEQLEFSHRKPTGLSGRSRGLIKRYLDVIRNPQCYQVLCKSCHREYDKTYVPF